MRGFCRHAGACVLPVLSIQRMAGAAVVHQRAADAANQRACVHMHAIVILCFIMCTVCIAAGLVRTTKIACWAFISHVDHAKDGRM